MGSYLFCVRTSVNEQAARQLQLMRSSESNSRRGFAFHFEFGAGGEESAAKRHAKVAIPTAEKRARLFPSK